ncbi:Stabilizer of axonemal microtubules 2 [Galemys pyrenaicus]|uniref:Stabilizer of axonemal microtubules 2 n=1 Tax=Galemys pyrenaicus TaxID=202257 RepID=A0A8J6DQ12_GALPY|nr:Stabilizer of axonemal microtubules 2 [Galemys pyrenaicus]
MTSLQNSDAQGRLPGVPVLPHPDTSLTVPAGRGVPGRGRLVRSSQPLAGPLISGRWPGTAVLWRRGLRVKPVLSPGLESQGQPLTLAGAHGGSGGCEPVSLPWKPKAASRFPCSHRRHRCLRGPTKLYESSGAAWPPTEYAEKYLAYGGTPRPAPGPRRESPAGRGRTAVTTVTSGPPPQGPEEQPGPQRSLQPVPTYRDHYRAWGPQPRRPCPPPQSYRPPAVRFGNPTTSQDAFAPPAASPPRSLQPPPAGPVRRDTSHRLDYVFHQLPPRPARPRAVYQPASRPFEGLTTHRRDFQGLAGEAARPCRPPLPRAAPDAPFKGSTEFRDSFRAWVVPPRECREAAGPTGSASRGAPPFEGVTQYSVEFTPKQWVACPAGYPCPPGYVFQGTDACGHRRFRRAPAARAC